MIVACPGHTHLGFLQVKKINMCTYTRFSSLEGSIYNISKKERFIHVYENDVIWCDDITCTSIVHILASPGRL